MTRLLPWLLSLGLLGALGVSVHSAWYWHNQALAEKAERWTLERQVREMAATCEWCKAECIKACRRAGLAGKE